MHYMTSTLREIAVISHDIRKITLKKIPKSMPRATVLFLNTKVHSNSESHKEVLKFAKISKYADCEVFFMVNATVDEFINVMRIFVTDVVEFLSVFAVCNRISLDLASKPPGLQFEDGVVDPALLFDILNCKAEENKILFSMDAINKPSDWIPSQHGAERSGVFLLAPYADPSSTDPTQFDRNTDAFFPHELSKVIKNDPTATLEQIATELENVICQFGLKVFAASYPENLYATEPCLA